MKKYIIAFTTLALFILSCSKKVQVNNLVMIENKIIALSSDDTFLWKIEEDIFSQFSSEIKVIKPKNKIAICPLYSININPYTTMSSFKPYLTFLYGISLKNGKIKWKIPLEGFHIVSGSVVRDIEKLLQIENRNSNFLIFTTMRFLKISKNGKNIQEKFLCNSNYYPGFFIKQVIHLDSSNYLLIGKYQDFAHFNAITGEYTTFSSRGQYYYPPVYANHKLYFLKDIDTTILKSKYSIDIYDEKGYFIKTLNPDIPPNIYDFKYALEGNYIYMVLNESLVYRIDTEIDEIQTWKTEFYVDTILQFGKRILLVNFKDLSFYRLKEEKIEKVKEFPNIALSHSGTGYEVKVSVCRSTSPLLFYVNKADSKIFVFDEELNKLKKIDGIFIGTSKEFWAFKRDDKVHLYKGLNKEVFSY